MCMVPATHGQADVVTLVRISIMAASMSFTRRYLIQIQAIGTAQEENILIQRNMVAHLFSTLIRRIMFHRLHNIAIALAQHIRISPMAAGLLGETPRIPAPLRERSKRALFIVTAPAARYLHTTIIVGKIGLPGQQLR